MFKIRSRMAVVMVLVTCGLAATVPAGEETAPAAAPAGWRFTLPPGDARAGEKVFRALKCWSCHRVEGLTIAEAGDQDGRIGPRLTRAQAVLPREYIAERLIRYDRFLEEGFRNATWSRSDGTSRMGNYNDTMSVRELIDLVEFVRSIGSVD